MIDRLASKHIVLLGVGHTNAHVLRMWGMNRIPDADLTCISDYSIATYSGMLPAVLAGLSAESEMQIDLVRLCASVGARLITDRVVGIDHAAREVRFEARPAIPFDVLSVGIGSVPATDSLASGGDRVIKIKPMQTFLRRIGEAIDQAADANPDSKLRLLVVGGGVAGTEISFCLPPFLERSGVCDHSLHLVTRSDQVLPHANGSIRERVLAEFNRRGVRLTTGRAVTRVEPGCVTLDDATTIDADLVIWATGAVAPRLLAELDLPLDERGFVATDATLRSVAGYPVFAVGDTGSIRGESVPKAGVYAVRQGPVVWENIQRLLDGRELQTYRPQRTFLKLINRGDGFALGQWRSLGFSGKWVMRLKDFIDSRFMEKYQPRPMMDDEGAPMQCRGCGCKLDGDLLETALDHYQADSKLEDAAIIARQSDTGLLASTDFFSSPFDDAYLAGRIAALHSASDIIASGARVTDALANVVIPEGDGATQRRMLQDFIAGARFEFEPMNASIVGGHTIVGPRLEVGFTVIGKAIGSSGIHKQGLRVGDQLLLTKPLGIGILLAAHARGLCRAADYENLLEAMLRRQHRIAEIAVDCGVTAGTDVTGFGLAGHLLEMLDGSGLAAVLDLTSIPMLSGVEDYLEQGIESSLGPANRRVGSRINGSRSTDLHRHSVLFDPQTCGGLLLGVDRSSMDALRKGFVDAGLPDVTRIGEVVSRTDDARMIELH